MANEFRSSKPLSLAVQVLFGIQIIALLLTVLMSIGLMASPDWMVTTEDGETLPVFMVFIGLAEVLQVAGFVGSIVMFLVWEYRAFSNLSPLEAGNLEFSPTSAVVWWFIPFLNLFKPYQAMKELWTASSPEIDEELGLHATGETVPAMFGFWWALWILFNIGSEIVAGVFNSEKPDYSNLALGELVVSSLGAVACVLLALIVRDIVGRQADRYERVARFRADAPPPPPVFGENV